MYAALWRLLPGPWPVKVVQCVILLLAVIAVCFVWLFPAVAPYMPFNDNTISPGSSSRGPLR